MNYAVSGFLYYYLPSELALDGIPKILAILECFDNLCHQLAPREAVR
jgi:hypothetical protein